MPDISVIICAYNAENTVAEAIESVLNQSMKNFELILINDGSNDSTLNIANTYAQNDARLRVIDQKNCGLGLSRNHAIKESKGNFIAFLDADDVWLKQKLELQIRVMNENESVDIVVTNTIAYDELEKGLPELNYNSDYYPDFFDLIVTKNFFFQPVTSLINRRLFDELAVFTDDHSGQDYYPFLVFALHNVRLFKLNCPLYGERSLPGSLQRSTRSRFISAMARYKAVQAVLKDKENVGYLTKERVSLLKKASDRFLTWSACGSRAYMNYVDALRFVASLYSSFYSKKYYVIELLKTTFFPLKQILFK